MINKELENHLIEQACLRDESAVAWLQEKHILPLSICAASSTVELEVWFPEDYYISDIPDADRDEQ